MADTVRYDEPTVEMLTREIGRFLIQEAALGRLGDFAAHVLDALADSGLLLPPGGKRHDEWRVRYHDRYGHEFVWATRKTRTEAESARQDAITHNVGARTPSLEMRSVTVWPDGSVYNGPWQAVDESTVEAT